MAERVSCLLDDSSYDAGDHLQPGDSLAGVGGPPVNLPALARWLHAVEGDTDGNE